MSANADVVALVPAKAFARAKSRLSPRLDGAQRKALAERMLRHVVGTLRQSSVVGGVWVLTADPSVADVARELECQVLPDQGATLRAIVDAGLRHVQTLGHRAALVCMADLPRLSPGEVRDAVAALTTHPVVLVADRQGLGTNLLGLRPPAHLPTSFGHADSFARHVRAARQQGEDALPLELEGARDDLDDPDDLDGVG